MITHEELIAMLAGNRTPVWNRKAIAYAKALAAIVSIIAVSASWLSLNGKGWDSALPFSILCAANVGILMRIFKDSSDGCSNNAKLVIAIEMVVIMSLLGYIVAYIHPDSPLLKLQVAGIAIWLLPILSILILNTKTQAISAIRIYEIQGAGRTISVYVDLGEQELVKLRRSHSADLIKQFKAKIVDAQWLTLPSEVRLADQAAIEGFGEIGYIISLERYRDIVRKLKRYPEFEGSLEAQLLRLLAPISSSLLEALSGRIKADFTATETFESLCRTLLLEAAQSNAASFGALGYSIQGIDVYPFCSHDLDSVALAVGDPVIPISPLGSI